MIVHSVGFPPQYIDDEPKATTPPVNEWGLRLDGPTLVEWVKAGYQTKHYPPHGYAVKQ